MRTLYVSDLDGTLLNSQQKLSHFTIATINALVEDGMLFSYATARSFVTAAQVTAGLNAHLPVIVYNGAFVLDSATGAPLLSACFTPSERDAVREVLTAHRIHPIVYAHIDGKECFSFYTGHTNRGKQLFLDSRKNDPRRTERATAGDVYTGDAFYFTCIGSDAELAPVHEGFRTDPRFACVYQKDLYSGEQWLEILPAKATKANAALRLKEHLGCEKIVSFGDGRNDLPLFAVSDECYAVGNADPTLQEHATAVIETNERDGVAKWLRQRHTKGLL